MRTFALAWKDEAYTHILLVLPLSCALLFLKRKSADYSSAPERGSAAVYLLLALLITGFAIWSPAGLFPDIRLSLSMISLVIWWIGTFILCFGTNTFRVLLFPLCFLFWIVPLPLVALDEVVYFLQNQSAFAARVMFIATGVPVTQDGIVLSIPNLDIEVARECSSIRSSMLLFITTMILAHLFLRSWWRKALLIAAAIPLAAIKNGLRIFTITELGTRVDPGFFDGNLHHRGGILFLAVSLIVMSVLLWWLRRTETLVPEPSRSS
jgi:exosortase